MLAKHAGSLPDFLRYILDPIIVYIAVGLVRLGGLEDFKANTRQMMNNGRVFESSFSAGLLEFFSLLIPQFIYLPENAMLHFYLPRIMQAILEI